MKTFTFELYDPERFNFGDELATLSEFFENKKEVVKRAHELSAMKKAKVLVRNEKGMQVGLVDFGWFADDSYY